MKKKFLVTCGILTIGATLFSNSVLAVPGTVTANSVRIRKEASTSSEVISLAVQGEKVNVIGKEEDWYKVEFEDVTGYISSSFVDTDFEESGNTSSSSNEPSSNNGETEPGESNTTKPDENKPQSPEQSQPQNSEQNGDNNETNSSEVSSNEETPSSSNASNNNMELGSKVKVEKEVSVRSLPNFSSKVTSNIANGTEITVLDQLNNWVKFTDGNVTGWGIKNEITGETEVPSENQPSGQQPENQPNNQSDSNQESQNTNGNQGQSSTQTGSTAPSESKSGSINVDRAVIRKAPNGETIDVLVMDTDVEIIGEEGDWYKINSEDYKGVYIAKRLVKVK